MKIEIIRNDLGVAMNLEGSLDLYTAAHLEKKLAQINIKNNQICVIDLLKIAHIDSSGVGCLIKISNIVKNAEGTFYLTRLPKTVLQVFQIAGLLTYFSVLSNDDYNKQFLNKKDDVETSELV